MEKENLELLVKALEGCFISPNESDRNGENANIVDSLGSIARAISEVSRSLDRLGVGNASTNMGAIELLAKEVKGLGENLK